MKRTASTGMTPTTAAFPNGSTTNGSARITGLTFLASEVKKGYMITVSAGFPSATQPYEVVDANPSAGWIDVELNATATVAGTVTVTTKQNYYTDGNAGAYARTVLNAVDRNHIQEEIANVILDNGGSLDSNVRTQLSNAVLKRAVAQTMNGNLTIAASKKIKCDTFEETTPANGITFVHLIRSFIGVASNVLQVLTGNVIAIENQMGHKVANSLKGANFDYSYKNKIQLKATNNTPISVAENTLINGIPGFVDTIKVFGLKVGIYFIDTATTEQREHGIEPALIPPSTITNHTAINPVTTSAMWASIETNSGSWSNPGGVGVKKIASDDYDLVYQPHATGFSAPYTAVIINVELEF